MDEGVKGIGPFGIDCREADKLVGIDSVARGIAEGHLVVACLGRAVLRTAFDRLQFDLHTDLLEVALQRGRHLAVGHVAGGHQQSGLRPRRAGVG